MGDGVEMALEEVEAEVVANTDELAVFPITLTQT